MFYFRKRTCVSFTIRPIATERKTWKRVRYQQVYPNKQFLETAGSNYERAFNDFVKLDRLRRLYFPRVDRYVHFSGPIFVCKID